MEQPSERSEVEIAKTRSVKLTDVAKAKGKRMTERRRRGSKKTRLTNRVVVDQGGCAII